MVNDGIAKTGDETSSSHKTNSRECIQDRGRISADRLSRRVRLPHPDITCTSPKKTLAGYFSRLQSHSVAL